MNYLNDAEKNAVVSFRNNEVMYNAVKKVLMHTITHQGTLNEGEAPELKNWVFSLGMDTLGSVPSNERMGEELKAALKGLGYLNNGFEKLNEVQVELPKKKKENPAL